MEVGLPCVREELECVTPKREPRELCEAAIESAGLEEFEFVGVKQEPLEYPVDAQVKEEPLEDQDEEFLPQEPECILVQKDEFVDGVQTGELRPTQEPECIIVQKEEPCDANGQPGELDHTQVQENGVQQKPPDIPGGEVEEEEILGLVPKVDWVPPCVPASEEAVRDPLASKVDTVTDSMNEKSHMTGWSQTSGENWHVSLGEANYNRPAVITANGGGRPYYSSATRRYKSDGTELVQQAFRCDSCSAIFSTKYHLVNHVFTHIIEVPPPSHVCRRCGEVFCDTASLIKHSKGHDNGPAVPAVIPERSRGSGTPVRGAMKCLETKPHICDLCGKAFPYVGNLNSHKRTHSGERPYRCDVCGRGFKQSSHLRNHRVTHASEKLHYCEFCGRGFSLPYTLKQHVRMHTGDNPYCCEVCGASFNLLSKLKTHMQSHTGTKPYECDECGKSFGAPSNLRRHKRKHSGEKPYGCDTCGESFMWYATLQRHKQLHTGKKPFECDLCASSFAEMGGLNRHMRTHAGDAGEKPFKCHLCVSSFAERGGLNRHMRCHRGERPYGCDMCGASFTAPNHLKRHQRKRHVENLPVLSA